MNHTLANGLELLLFLADAPRPHGISELAQSLNLPKSHVHRLLQTLVENQYVEKDHKRRYVIGVGALRLGHALLRNIPIRQHALPAMQRAVRRIHLPMTLALPFGSSAITVAYVTHDGQIKQTSETLGGVLSPYASASGKLFLAFMPVKKRDATLKELDYTPMGPNTHRSAASLRKNLITIAKQDYSLNDRENGEESASLAVPIRNVAGNVFACLGLSGHYSEMLPARLPELLDALHLTVNQIQSNLMEIDS
jgi:DNA-binding IclR family transcriptional regulator